MTMAGPWGPHRRGSAVALMALILAGAVTSTLARAITLPRGAETKGIGGDSKNASVDKRPAAEPAIAHKGARQEHGVGSQPAATTADHPVSKATQAEVSTQRRSHEPGRPVMQANDVLLQLSSHAAAAQREVDSVTPGALPPRVKAAADDAADEAAGEWDVLALADLLRHIDVQAFDTTRRPTVLTQSRGGGVVSTTSNVAGGLVSDITLDEDVLVAKYAGPDATDENDEFTAGLPRAQPDASLLAAADGHLFHQAVSAFGDPQAASDAALDDAEDAETARLELQALMRSNLLRGRREASALIAARAAAAASTLQHLAAHHDRAVRDLILLDETQQLGGTYGDVDTDDLGDSLGEQDPWPARWLGAPLAVLTDLVGALVDSTQPVLSALCWGPRAPGPDDTLVDDLADVPGLLPELPLDEDEQEAIDAAFEGVVDSEDEEWADDDWEEEEEDDEDDDEFGDDVGDDVDDDAFSAWRPVSGGAMGSTTQQPRAMPPTAGAHRPSSVLLWLTGATDSAPGSSAGVAVGGDGDEEEEEGSPADVLLLCVLLAATSAMLVGFIKTFLQLSRAMRREVLLPFVIEHDGQLRHGFLLVDEQRLGGVVGGTQPVLSGTLASPGGLGKLVGSWGCSQGKGGCAGESMDDAAPWP